MFSADKSIAKGQAGPGYQELELALKTQKFQLQSKLD